MSVHCTVKNNNKQNILWCLLDARPRQCEPSTEICWCRRQNNQWLHRKWQGRSRHRVNAWSCTRHSRLMTWLCRPKGHTTISRSDRSKISSNRTRLRTIGDRAFGIAGARVWNDLPSSVVSAPSLAVFKRIWRPTFFGSPTVTDVNAF